MHVIVGDFVFEITGNFVFIQIPYIGALFTGIDLPTVFDSWSAIKRRT